MKASTRPVYPSIQHGDTRYSSSDNIFILLLYLFTSTALDKWDIYCHYCIGTTMHSQQPQLSTLWLSLYAFATYQGNHFGHTWGVPYIFYLYLAFFFPPFLGRVLKFCLRKLVEKPQFTVATLLSTSLPICLLLVSDSVFFSDCFLSLLSFYSSLLPVLSLPSQMAPCCKWELPEDTRTYTQDERCSVHMSTDERLHSTFLHSTH